MQPRLYASTDCFAASDSLSAGSLVAIRGTRAGWIPFPKPTETSLMDRRTVLAFALIFLIIIGSDWVMKHYFRSAPADSETMSATVEKVNSEPESPTDSLAVSTTTSVPTAPEAPAQAASTDTPSTADAVLRVVGEPGTTSEVEVTTPLYVARISSVGARITSWQGFEHEDHEGNPVEMIPQGEEAARYGDDAVTFAAGSLDLGKRNFRIQGPTSVVVQSGARSVTFSVATAGGLEVRKIYTFNANSYAITEDIDVVAATTDAAASLRLVGAPARARFAWPEGIATTEHNDRIGKVAFKAFAKVGDDLHRKNRTQLHKGVEKVSGEYTGTVAFATVQNKYFTVAGILPQAPDQVIEGTIVLGGDVQRNQQTWTIEAPLRSQPAGSDVIAGSRLTLYIGPQEAERLKSFGVGLEKTMDLGWALFRPLTEAVLWIMDGMHKVIPNYGVIIIIFSVATKLMFYPLTRTSTESMKKMQLLQPKIKELQQKYKDNREKQSQEMMKLYQKEKINPMAGCLPMLVQSPVFIALYQALAHMIALRGTPFIGWINDLSQPDTLFVFPGALPFLGGHPFNLLPILMSATMWVQSKLTPTGTTGGQMAMMNNFLPVIFLFMFYQMPSGLVLYWLVNNLMTIYQTWRIHSAATRTGGAVPA